MMVPNAICVVAKCPIPGKSKTRLRGGASAYTYTGSSGTGTGTGLTDEGCGRMAKAMLCDVVMGIQNAKSLSSAVKFLYHAPADDDGRRIMGSILDELGVPYTYHCNCDVDTDTSGSSKRQNQHAQENTAATPRTTWYLCPMPDANRSNLRSSDLGSKLAGMLEQTRSIVRSEFACTRGNSAEDTTSPPAVAFLGMDSPELPIAEIAYALRLASGESNDAGSATTAANANSSSSSSSSNNNSISSSKGLAYINPSHDGGYGMLCLPPHAPPTVFEGVRWSHPLTAVSQMKALSDEGIAVTIGSLMRDIDEMEDLMGLAQRLRLIRSSKHDGSSGDDDKNEMENGGDKLRSPPPGRGIEKATGAENGNACQYSWKTIQQLKIGC